MDLVALPFSDKFDDSLTFNKWAGTTIQPAGAGTAEVVSLKPNSPPNHARFVINALDGWVYSSVKQAISSNIVYARSYFQLNSYPSVTDDAVNLILLAGTSGLAYAGIIKRWDGTFRWQLIGRGTGGTYPTSIATTGPAVGDGYHCIEVRWEYSAVSPIVQMFVDGLLVASLTLATHPTLNTTEFGTCTVVSFGIAEKKGTAYPLDVYADDCVIDNKYIGPLPAGTYFLDMSMSPINGRFTVGGVEVPSPYHQEYPTGTVLNIIMPTKLAAAYLFKEWSDGDNNPSKTVDLQANTTLIAYYLPPENMPFSDGFANLNKWARKEGSWTVK